LREQVSGAIYPGGDMRIDRTNWQNVAMFDRQPRQAAADATKVVVVKYPLAKLTRAAKPASATAFDIVGRYE
jgi:hypothetical protein